MGSVVAYGDNMAFATGKHNSAVQLLEQSSLTGQDSEVVVLKMIQLPHVTTDLYSQLE